MLFDAAADEPGDGTPTTAWLPLDSIRTDGGTQPRAQLDGAAVEEYADLHDAGVAFPPAVVFHDGGDYWLADGFHRYHGAKKVGKPSLLCEVRRGTVEEARWYAFGANKAHGLRRTNEDKRRAVQAALRMKPEKSDRAIADHCGVHHDTVSEYRKRLSDSDSQPAVRIGRDGKQHPATGVGKGKTQGTGKTKPTGITGACLELNRLVKGKRIDRATAQRLAELLPSKAEQTLVVQRGAEEIRRTVAVMGAERRWVQNAESWREKTKWSSPVERPEIAGPLTAKDKEQALTALAEARDRLTSWIETIKGWPTA
jgi:hypothetical protein